MNTNNSNASKIRKLHDKDTKYTADLGDREMTFISGNTEMSTRQWHMR